MTTSFIKFDKDDNVTISNALVFHNNDYGVYTEYSGNNSKHKTVNLYVYNSLPKWYQIKEWFILIQRLRSFTNSNVTNHNFKG